MKLKQANSAKIYPHASAILGLTQKWKTDNNKIVFTNGCFDILHVGHVDYLEKAANKGDKLVVGLNTDNSIKRLKGQDRPINNQEHRALLLASLAVVDAVVLFDEETPIQLIESIIPHVLIKGNDYAIENIVGAETVINSGGKVETIAFIHRVSTSEIIDKIQAL